MSTYAPINRLTSPNANKISFNGKNFLEAPSPIVATATKGTNSFGLKATFNAGKISFQPTTNLPNDSNHTNALRQFNRDIHLSAYSYTNGQVNFKKLFEDCNTHVESWVATNRNFGFLAKKLGNFHSNNQTTNTSPTYSPQPKAPTPPVLPPAFAHNKKGRKTLALI